MSVLFLWGINYTNYDYYDAVRMYEDCNWYEAKDVFESLPESDDNSAYIALCNYHIAIYELGYGYNSDEIEILRTVFRDLEAHSDTNRECKEALTDSCFTLMKIYNNSYVCDEYDFYLYSKHGDTSIWFSCYLQWDVDDYDYWDFYMEDGAYGTMYCCWDDESKDDVAWFEIVSFDDPYAESPKSVTIKNVKNGKKYTFKR